MEQKNDIGYFSVPMNIYPRILYIAKGKDKKGVIQNNFTDREGNDLVFSDDNTSDACSWEVIEKSNHKYGFLIWLYGDVSVDVIAHESTHIAFETFRDIGGLADEDNQEPFAYLLGWVARQIKYSLDYNKHKNK